MHAQVKRSLGQWLRRRWLWFAVPGLVLVGVVIGLYAFYPKLGAWAIRTKAISKLEQRFQRRVNVGDIAVSRDGSAVLRNVTIAGDNDGDAPLVSIARVDIEYDFWDSCFGNLTLYDVAVIGAKVALRQSRTGETNYRDLVDRLRTKRKGRSTGGRLRPARLSVHDSTLHFSNEANGDVATIADLSVTAIRDKPATIRLDGIDATSGAGPHAAFETVTISAAPRQLLETAAVDFRGGSLSLWRGMRLTDIDGSVNTNAGRSNDGRLSVTVTGSYGGLGERLWQAHGWLDPRSRLGEIDLEAEKFSFDKLTPILEKSAVVDYDDTAVDGKVTVRFAPDHTKLAGSFRIVGLNLFNRRVAEKTVRNIEAAGTFAGRYHFRDRTLELERAQVESRGVTYQVNATVQLPGGIRSDNGERRIKHRLRGYVEVPSISCKRMLAGIPNELVPNIAGAKVTGTFTARVGVDIDWEDLDATQLYGATPNKRAYVGLRRCRFRKMTAAMDAKRLQQQFKHHVEVEKDKWLSFIIGPGNPDFAPLDDISPYLVRSLMSTEDSRFFKHHGFIPREFRSALISNLKARKFKHGASSITMQMVKNVMLYSKKTLSRKLEELILTHYIETQLDKERIMEIYLNAIEYGPGLYGIGPATQLYFGKHPRDINPVEAAFYSSILPSPKVRFKQYCEGKLKKRWKRKIANILRIMNKRKDDGVPRLTDEEYAAAKDMEFAFYRDPNLDVNACKKRADRAIKRARSTSPLKP